MKRVQALGKNTCIEIPSKAPMDICSVNILTSQITKEMQMQIMMPHFNYDSCNYNKNKGLSRYFRR